MLSAKLKQNLQITITCFNINQKLYCIVLIEYGFFTFSEKYKNKHLLNIVTYFH